MSAKFWNDLRVADLVGGTLDEAYVKFPHHAQETIRTHYYRFRKNRSDLVPKVQERAESVNTHIPAQDMVPRALYTKAMRKLDDMSDKRREYMEALKDAVHEAI